MSESGGWRRIDFIARDEDMEIIREIMNLMGCDMTHAIRASLGIMRHVKLGLDRSSLIKGD
jgi:hypothetical protein